MNRSQRLRHLWQMASVLAITLAACARAHAQDIPGYPGLHAYDAREVALLPRYCSYTQGFREKVPGGNDSEELRRWQSQLGSDVFNHMHHYCWGLMKTNRGVLLARDAHVRESYLSDSLNEFEYIIARVPENFILLPEMLTKKGENLIRLGKGPMGILELERAAGLKPDYWPPYAQMSDYYRQLGDVRKAKELLERGLSFAPDAVALKRRLTELNSGKGSTKSPSKPGKAAASGD